MNHKDEARKQAELGGDQDRGGGQEGEALIVRDYKSDQSTCIKNGHLYHEGEQLKTGMMLFSLTYDLTVVPSKQIISFERSGFVGGALSFKEFVDTYGG